MARQNIVPNPAQKLFEAYMDFSGGLNSEVANEKLKDTEFPVFQNVDLSGRASAKRRYGRDLIASIAGTAQGMQWFYRSGQPAPDLFIAVSGKLYVALNSAPSLFLNVPTVDLNGSAFTFQSTLPIEMVQYRTSLFVATGTKLVEVVVDTTKPCGFSATQVSPYKPSSLEVINQGLNTLADNPASWITDVGGSTVKIDSITWNPTQPVINKPTYFTAHVEKPSNVQLNYTWSSRPAGSGSFQTMGTFADNNANLTFTNTGGYDVQVQTSTVTVPIASWNGSTEGWTNFTAGNNWDSQPDFIGCAIFTGTTACAEDSSLLAWKDFSTPIDLSGSDTIDWFWTVAGNPANANAIQIKFYTQGNLTTPIMTVGNAGGESFRGIYTSDPVPACWNRTKATYDKNIAGLNKIVRIGFAGGVIQVGGYVPNNGTFSIAKSDTATRVDNLMAYLSTASTSFTQSSIQVLGATNPATDLTTYASIQTCRMVRLDEASGSLILGKDSTYPGQIYVSAVNNPRYFPASGRIDFSEGTNDPVTSFLRFQNYYMAFTKTSISVIEGLGTTSYTVKKVHSEIGCIADRSAKVVNNDVYFLSAEGIYKVTPHPYRIDIMNVARIDWQMKSEITPDTDACAITYDNQYWIAFPSKQIVYRMYYDMGVWVKDVSSKLNIAQFLQYGSTMYQLSTDGNLYQSDKTRYDDAGEAYVMQIESKYFDLDASFNFKKLKRAYFLTHAYGDHSANYSATITADGAIVLDPQETTFPIVNGVASIQTTPVPNVLFTSGTSFGNWLLGSSPFGDTNVAAKVLHIHGKARRVKVKFEQSDPVLCELFGFGLEFKMKKPY